ncbi:anaphase-promoting complex subunit 4 [Momordica charantia]|uniref:Anaphase-promoting complex subunit 4 n=1 Tax=Momordica charantia TaxID=3673 RepID=A0A6J1CKL4_MOMCH|nr:anaphase-promoting complex subunit 4 [Momordica charantia]
METDEAERVLPFQLQFDKSIASQVKIAEWNPEKDLLAMVTEDSKILLHRFNWQRLWTISPGRSIKSLCWRPDGKVIAVGLEDGTISLHDVENGKLLRSMKSHEVAVVSLNWVEDSQLITDINENLSAYEDRTSRIFPPAPTVPRMHGLVSGDTGFIDDSEDSFTELSNSSQQRFNILCSGDKDGSICFSIFGIFPIGKINIHKLHIPLQVQDAGASYHLLNAEIYKVALSKDLCRLIVMCSGELVGDGHDPRNRQTNVQGVHGMHSLVLDTSIFRKRKSELHQVAQQASNIGELIEVIRVSLSVMSKQWSDAMHTFREKFDALSMLIINHGLDSSPQEEFLSLLGGARTSQSIHQFLVNSLGEVGAKRVSKAISSAGSELQLIVLDHLQPAVEIIGFRMGELLGLSRWRARFQGVGLDEELINNAMEKAGMLLVQVDRFMRVLSTVLQQFSNFFNWLIRCIKLLMSEPSDQLLPYNSELVIIFLKFLYNQDPVKKLLEASENDDSIEIDLEIIERVRELTLFGGFSDCGFLRRTLGMEFQQMESSFKEAFLMPFSTISRKILCEDLLSLFPFQSSSSCLSSSVPLSVSYYEDSSEAVFAPQSCQQKFIDYISFKIPDDSSADIANCVGIARGFVHDLSCSNEDYSSFEAILVSIPDGSKCVDLSLYKDGQIVLLLNETASTSESCVSSYMMVVQANDLPFAPMSRSPSLDDWKVHQLKDYVVPLQMENEKVRNIPHAVVPPLAVSASRGVACVFGARKRALVYILEEDEDEASDAE